MRLYFFYGTYIGRSCYWTDKFLLSLYWKEFFKWKLHLHFALICEGLLRCCPEKNKEVFVVLIFQFQKPIFFEFEKEMNQLVS